MRKHFFLLTIALLVFSVCTFAQQGAITGTVKADDGTPLPGATVLVKGTSTGVITDIDGNYSISVAGVTDATLVYSYVGYLNEEMVVGDQTSINVTLITDMLKVDEVIVVGYGTMKKSVVTGAIAKVDAEELKNSQSTRVESALQGRTAGVTVAKESGAPGAAMTVRVRGVGSNQNTGPIYIVDGMQTGGIDYLDVNDIESIEVMKDAASAAIYGARAGNGVVLITTKGGKVGEGKVSYSNAFSTQEVKTDFRTMNAQEYIDYYLAADPRSQATIDDALALGTYDTDWLDQISGPAPMQKHNLQFSGGDDKGTYYLSANYLNQEGAIGGEKSSFERYTFTTNATRNVKKWLTIGSKITYTHKVNRGVDENDVYGSLMQNALLLDPLTSPYVTTEAQLPSDALPTIKGMVGKDWWTTPGMHDDNGIFGISAIHNAGELRNPLAALVNEREIRAEDKILMGAYADVKFLKDFTFHTAIDVDYAMVGEKNWTPVFWHSVLRYNEISNVEEKHNRYYKWKTDNYITYSKSLGVNNFSVVAGMAFEDYNHQYLQATAGHMVRETEQFAYLRTLTDTLDRTTDDYDANRLASYFGRVSYDYDGTYLATFTYRSDGSSKFGPNNRFRSFPSASLGWNLDKMDFWTVEAINKFKLRASYGRNGSLSNLEDFDYASVVRETGYNYADANGVPIPMAEPEKLSNPNLKWEEMQQTDIGADLAMFNNRLTFTTDFYDKRTKQLIFDGSTPDIAGNTNPPINIGEIQNVGIEFEVGGQNNFGDLRTNFGITAAYNKNKVINLDGISELGVGGGQWGTVSPTTRFKEDMPAWYFWGYETDGIFNSQEEIDNYVDAYGVKIQPRAKPGDVKVVDHDTTNYSTPTAARINELDKVKIGDPNPDWLFGFNLTLEFKGIDVYAFFTGTVGNDIAFESMRADRNYINRPVWWTEDRWTEENHSQDWFAASTTSSWNTTNFHDYFVFSGSYLRMKNLTIGYTLPSNLTKKAGIDRLRFYFTGENLFTLTKYPGLDPELGGRTAVGFFGIDQGSYPTARVLTFGVNVDF